jgi:hypothetical protein
VNRGDLERVLARNEIPIARDREGHLYIISYSECVERFGADYMRSVSQELEFDRYLENFSEF